MTVKMRNVSRTSGPEARCLDALIGGASGELFLDFRIGLQPYVQLPSPGFFNAGLYMNVDVLLGNADTGRNQNFEFGIDTLLLKLLGSFGPQLKAKAELLSNTVFAEHVFDISKYIKKLPDGKLEARFTGLDIKGIVGANITEDLTVDNTGTDADEDAPDINVTLYKLDEDGNRVGRSKSSTLLDLENGGEISFNAPSGTGEVDFEAVYDLTNVTFDHSMGLGLNAVLNIKALEGKLDGSEGCYGWTGGCPSSPPAQERPYAQCGDFRLCPDAS